MILQKVNTTTLELDSRPLTFLTSEVAFGLLVGQFGKTFVIGGTYLPIYYFCNIGNDLLVSAPIPGLNSFVTIIYQSSIGAYCIHYFFHFMYLDKSQGLHGQVLRS